MKKRIIVIGVLILCIASLIYFETTTYLSGGKNSYERFDQEYELQNGEILHGCMWFHKHGVAPVRIDKISVTDNKNNIPVEIKVFLCNRQSMQMIGGPVKEIDFEKDYGSNLITSEQLKWLHDKDFQIVVTTEQYQLSGIYLEVEYSVLGIFRKKIHTEELIV